MLLTRGLRRLSRTLIRDYEFLRVNLRRCGAMLTTLLEKRWITIRSMRRIAG
jgi:hypothetical protein